MKKSIQHKILNGIALAIVFLMAEGCSQKTSEKTVSAPTQATNVEVTQKVYSFKNLVIYNMNGAISSDIISNFDKEFHIKTNYKTFSGNEELQGKLIKGNSGFDLVSPGATYAKTQIEKGLLLKLDKKRLSNYSNLDPIFLDKLKSVDPENDYLIPLSWGYTTVGINYTKVKEILKDMPMPEEAWDLVLNPKYTNKLKECGISFMDSGLEMFPIALHYSGKSAYSKDSADHEVALETLKKVRPDVTFFTDSVSDDLAGRRSCVVVGWSGDINLAAQKMKDSGEKDEIKVLIPKLGAMLFIDTFAISKEAKNITETYTFLNYFLDPRVSAKISNMTNNLSGNINAVSYLDEKIIKNTTILVPDDDLRSMVAPESLDKETVDQYTSLYKEFKEMEIRAIDVKKGKK